MARMELSRQVADKALAEGRAVYGLTTGLGERSVHAISGDEVHAFSLRTIAGRAHAVGTPLDAATVRALMATRLNGLCAGGSGAAPGIAVALADILNAGLVPHIPETGSIGASDLCMMAHLGLAMVGEGAFMVDGAVRPGDEALRAAGLAPVELGLKDGLAICNASSYSAGLAGLALQEAGELIAAAQSAAALSLTGFRATLTPFDPRMAVARPQPGQARAAEELMRLLAGSGLDQPGAARRLQDPLSLRCIAPIHGAVYAALDFARDALMPELNGAADNPLVLIEAGEILSNGNFQTPLLTVALDALSQSLAGAAHAIAARATRLLNARLSGLPANLAPGGPSFTGMAAFLKPMESLVAEIRHLAQPAGAGWSLAADGVEDLMTGTPLAARRLSDLLARFRRLVAIEFIVAAQAVELAEIDPAEGSAVLKLHANVRRHSAFLATDRPLGGEIEALAVALPIR
jgi:histidine ammonia-lyase